MIHPRYFASLDVTGGEDRNENWILYRKIGWALWSVGLDESEPGRFRGAELSPDALDDLLFQLKHIQAVHRGSAVAILVISYLEDGRMQRIRVLP